jgi:hypothetical protein
MNNQITQTNTFFMKQAGFLFLFLLMLMGADAQTGSISGRVADSASRKLLAFATVTVFKAKDTSIVTYRLSSPEGEFKVGGLPLDMPLRALITYSGYKPLRKEFTLSAANPNLVLDTLSLSTTAQQLDEVVVIAERPPVSMKNDTIEFNANSFKTLPNALVEDLLKKLPGVSVDGDGNITVNGKPVNRILVDGKVFFGNDPKMATRNLPANIIDKVQVTDDKEELQRNGDDNLANVGKVVNITLKKGVKKGWFGKVYAGGGGDQRYEAGAIANIFRDTLQVSVLGYANNLNRPGFSYSDLMQTAGLDRSNSNLNSRNTSIWNNGSGSGISINGINFGGSQNFGGIATSKGLGVNINHAPNAKQSLFAQYFYGNIMIDRLNRNSSEQHNLDTIVTNNSVLTGDVFTNAHNIGIGGKIKPDSVTTIQFSANYMIGKQDEYRFTDVSAKHNILGDMSYGDIDQNNKANTYYYRQNFTYTHLSPTKKGRRLSLINDVSINNRFNDYYTNSWVHYVRPTAYDSLLNQLRDENVPRTDIITTLNYSEPMSKISTMRLGARYEYGKLTNDVTTFNPDSLGIKYDRINPSLSNTFFRESHRAQAMAGFEFKLSKDMTITPGARILVQRVNNALSSVASSIEQKETNLLPQLTFVYKQFTFNYSEDIVLPNYNFLLPVTDNTNPYLISRGNPTLRSAQRHNLSAYYYMSNPKKNLNINLNANGGFAYDEVIQNIVVDQKGIQTNTPLNADGTSNFGINYNINKQYKTNPKFIVSWNLGAWYGYNRSKLLYNFESSFQSTYNINQWAGFSFNFNDKVEWNNSYSIGYNFTHYTSDAFKKLEVTTQYGNSELVVRYPKHVIWETNANIVYNSSIGNGLPKTIVRWNAALNFTMLKDEKGVLKIGIFDILNRNAGINMYASRNMVSTNETNVLGRYLMATFTHNIRAIGGAKKKVGGEKLFLF